MDACLVLPNGRQIFQNGDAIRSRGIATVIMADALTASLRSALCAPLGVTTLPHGYFVKTGFRLPDGDVLSFYIVEDGDGQVHLEDDGTTVPDAIARGLDLNSPHREGMLR